jgi:hypothetical protein
MKNFIYKCLDKLQMFLGAIVGIDVAEGDWRS